MPLTPSTSTPPHHLGSTAPAARHATAVARTTVLHTARRLCWLAPMALGIWGCASAQTTPTGETAAHRSPAGAPSSAAAQRLVSHTIATGLSHPWAVAFLPDGRFLVTERPGRMRVIEATGRLNPPVQGLPPVVAQGQGGLLDVMLDSDFARNRRLYFCYSQAGTGADAGKNSTAVASATLNTEATALQELRPLFTQQPLYDSALHFGCRIVERMVDGRSDGTLFVTLGERSHHKDEAQNLHSHLGKIVRIGKDGSVPADNPFAGQAKALPEIWSYGHRSPQGAALAPDGQLWMHEHGPQGGDELNRITPQRNYGWPVITYGVNYGGARIGQGITHSAGMEQPVHTWVPSIAPSGMTFVTSDRYGTEWKGSIVLGALKAQRLERIQLQGTRVVAHEQLLPQLGQRIRDVRQGPDGWLYALTDAPDGQLIQLRLR